MAEVSPRLCSMVDRSEEYFLQEINDSVKKIIESYFEIETNDQEDDWVTIANYLTDEQFQELEDLSDLLSEINNLNVMLWGLRDAIMEIQYLRDNPE
jgi:hypothetical protein